MQADRHEGCVVQLAGVPQVSNKIGRPPVPADVRFWLSVTKSDGCWEWSKCRGVSGYGRIQINQKSVEAHRFSYEMHYGPIPEGMCVCHHCDNPACVRPDHLFLGTHGDNANDKINKGRQPAGEQLPQTKLTDSQVCLIREMCRRFPPTRLKSSVAYGVQSFLARWFGVAQAHISNVHLSKSRKE
jgi:hypothetical protein